MQRPSSTAKRVCDQLFKYGNNKYETVLTQKRESSCDVFINHRGIDTKKNVAGLLYHHLRRFGLNPFLDSKNMKPGDKLFDKINVAIRQSKVCVAVLSPNYCDSYFCLHELSLMMEAGKKVVPIFCGIKPSELVVKDDGSCSSEELDGFRRALREVKLTVGITFDTSTGDWAEFLGSASDAILKNLVEVELEEEEEKQIVEPKFKLTSSL